MCAQSAARRRKSFIAMRCVLGQSNRSHEGWCFLDLDTRRWYTSARRRWYIVKNDHPKRLSGCFVAVMDGGLVCRHLKPSVPSNDTQAQRFSIMVCNPIAPKIRKKELSSVPGHLKSKSYAALNLVVDNISQRFKIFVINQHVCASFAPSVKIQNDPLIMRIYDSATNEWQGSTSPFCVSSRGVGSVSSTVVFQGSLYVLFSSLYVLFGSRRGYLDGRVETIEEEISRHNIGEDAWEKVNVDIAAKLFSVKLFESANRLFRIRWFLDSSRMIDVEKWRLEVSEIKFPGMVLERLFEMSKADVVHLFDEEHSPSRNPGVVASGFGNCVLLICKSSQKMMVLDLETRLWDQLPANPLWVPLGDGFYFDLNECCFANPISHMNPMLPSSLWYLEGEDAADHQEGD